MKKQLLFRRIWLMLTALALCAFLLCSCTDDWDEVSYVGTSADGDGQTGEITNAPSDTSSDSVSDSDGKGSVGENGTPDSPSDSNGSSEDNDPWLPDKNWILP